MQWFKNFTVRIGSVLMGLVLSFVQFGFRAIKGLNKEDTNSTRRVNFDHFYHLKSQVNFFKMLNASYFRISRKHCNDFFLNDIDPIKSSQLSISELVKANASSQLKYCWRINHLQLGHACCCQQLP